jgi:hypothetical protein
MRVPNLLELDRPNKPCVFFYRRLVGRKQDKSYETFGGLGTGMQCALSFFFLSCEYSAQVHQNSIGCCLAKAGFSGQSCA